MGVGGVGVVVEREKGDGRLRSYQRPDFGVGTVREVEEVKREVESMPVKVAVASPDRSRAAAERKVADDIEDLSDEDGAFETLKVSAKRAAERRILPNHPPPLRQGQAAKKQGKGLPWLSNDLTRPLKLTDLGSIPKLPYKANWMVNVLAVITSLSDVEPSHLPPHNQRTARLADPTTSKRVLLAVYLEPEAFTPRIGDVVLLVGVKNHASDGGSLRKYVSDKMKNGQSWWVANPESLGWCEAEVQGLRTWWENVQQVEEDG